MTDLLELLDKLETMVFAEIEIEEKTTETEGFTLKISRATKATKMIGATNKHASSNHSIEEFGGFTTAKEVKEPGLASHGQVKYAKDLLNKSFSESEIELMDFLAHTLQLPLQDVPHPDTWDETLTRDMAATLLNPLEKMNGIHKKR